MIKIFEFLIHGCWHKWEEPTGPLVKWFSNLSGTYSHRTRTSKCSKCNRRKDMKV